MPLRSLGILLAAVMACSGVASAGVIRGHLSLPADGRHAGAKSAPVADAPLRVQRGITDAVITLDQIPDKVERKLTHRGWFAPKPKLPRIVQAHLRFEPRVLVIAAGTPVEFQNLDKVFHSTFSVSAAKRFDLGKYKPGTLDTVAFDRPGVANLHCDIHPDEIGFVVVAPNHAFARPDSLGRFTLPSLPPGKYMVRVWHPRLGELHRETEMPRHGDVDLELKY
jgi:hypothetical protein